MRCKENGERFSQGQVDEQKSTTDLPISPSVLDALPLSLLPIYIDLPPVDEGDGLSLNV